MRDQAIKPTLVDLAEEMLPHTAPDRSTIINSGSLEVDCFT
jgi:hypothetical protein